MEDQDPGLETARVWQPLLCLALLGSIAFSALALELLVHSEALGVLMDAEWARVNETANEYARVYRDTEDRIVLQDLPALDASEGGVYFFGSSNMKWAMRLSDQPLRRKLIHDFGAGEGIPYFHLQFTKFLVEEKGIAKAGPGKTLIVYGASFINAQAFSHDDPNAVFPNMWRRYGLYRYNDTEGIDPVDLGPFWDAYLLEKARASSFIHGLIDRGGRLIVPKSLRRRNTEKNAAVYATDYKRRMGQNWERTIRRQRAGLQDWLDYVRRQRMAFMVVLLPLASWHRRMPYPPVYRVMIEEFCRTNQVPLVDLTHLLTDDEFFDHIHANERGLTKTDAALSGIARAFLRKAGEWPAAPQFSRLPRANIGVWPISTRPSSE